MKIKEINEKEFQEEVLNNNEKVLVDFYANWCGPCRMLRPVLEDLASERKMKIMSLNVDEAGELARSYQVISIPCLILFENGNEVSRSVGLKSKEELTRFIEGK